MQLYRFKHSNGGKSQSSKADKDIHLEWGSLQSPSLVRICQDKMTNNFSFQTTSGDYQQILNSIMKQGRQSSPAQYLRQLNDQQLFELSETNKSLFLKFDTVERSKVV
jgi:hypothetical protein